MGRVARWLAAGGLSRYTSLESAGRGWETQMANLIIYLLTFLNYLIQLYVYVIIASVILSWLMAFGVVNPYNNFVRALAQAFAAVTEPVMRPIRNSLPDFGGIDFSPLIVLLGCMFIQGLIGNVLIPAVASSM